MRPAVHLILAAASAIACAEPSASTEPGLNPGLYVLDSIAPGPGAVVLVETDSDTLTTYQTIDFDSITVAADSTIRRKVRAALYWARAGTRPVPVNTYEIDGPGKLLPRDDGKVVMAPIGPEMEPVLLEPHGEVWLRSVASLRSRCDAQGCVTSTQVLSAQYRRR